MRDEHIGTEFDKGCERHRWRADKARWSDALCPTLGRGPLAQSASSAAQHLVPQVKASTSVKFSSIFLITSLIPEIPRLREAKAFSVFSVFDVSLKVKTEDAHIAKHAHLKRLVT